VLDNHVEALVRARTVDFAEVLGSLKREELQAVCEALGLERGGARRRRWCCGSGGMLIECAKYVERHGGDSHPNGSRPS
jgi:hypothetical protein